MAQAKVCKKKCTLSDYSHRRPRLSLLEKGASDPHRQQFYHGLVNTPITTHLQGKPPSHAYHPQLVHAPLPSYHRRSSSITEVVLGNKVKRIALEDEFSYNRMASDVTEQLRLPPPSHAMDSNNVVPWFGRTKTYVTDPSVDDFPVKKTEIIRSPLSRNTQRSENCPSSNGRKSADKTSCCPQASEKCPSSLGISERDVDGALEINAKMPMRPHSSAEVLLHEEHKKEKNEDRSVCGG